MNSAEPPGRPPSNPGNRRWVAALLVGVILATALAAFLWWRSRPGAHLAEARRQLEAGELEAALAGLPLAESNRSTRDRALLLRARIALERNRPADAVGPLNQIDPRSPQAVEADYWKARALLAVGNKRGAVDWLRKVLERQPDHLDALRWLGAASYELGDTKTAIASLTRVTRLRPTDAGAWRTLGVIYAEEQLYDKAGAAYQASLERAPSPDVELELAETLVKRGMFAHAEPHLASARGCTQEARRLELRAECLRARDDQDELQALLGAALETYPENAGLLGQRAALAQRAGRAAEALALLDRAVAASPNRPEFAYQRALTLTRLDRGPEAQQEMARYRELNALTTKLSDLTRRAADRPRDAAVRRELAELALTLGDRRLAAYWYRAALGADPSDQAAMSGLRSLQGP